jgi:hypothetical protein
VDSVYTDFSKAFDRVHHQLLLEEMSVGIEPARCLWLRSYLTGRIQRIRIGDVVSKDIRVTSGVPQGSHNVIINLMSALEVRRFSYTNIK